jgi:hypothetical protein
MQYGVEQVKANVTVDTSVLMFPDDALEFAANWIIVRQKDEKDGVTIGVHYHIRKRTEEDGHGVVLRDSM